MLRSSCAPALLSLLLAACGVGARNGGGGFEPNGGAGGGGSGGANGGGSGSDSDGGSVTSVDPGGPQDTACSEQKFAPKKVGDPDILILQDTSGSMSDGTPSKYDQVVAAVSDVINQLGAQMSPVEWGLQVFPTDDSCGVASSPQVPVAAGNGQAIVQAIQAKTPGGNTPLADTVKSAVAYYSGLHDGRAHFLLVATDGEPNCDSGSAALPMACKTNADCGGGGMVCTPIPILGGLCTDPTGGGATKEIAAAAALGIKTYVVGIALDPADGPTLDQMASAGGTARAGSPKYYPVADQATLEGALKSITAQVISCSFKVTSLPMSNQMIVVTVDGQTVAVDRTHANGWDFDAASLTLTFYGNACMQLQAHPGVVSVGYTCPPPG
jgi:hypothetical protein